MRSTLAARLVEAMPSRKRAQGQSKKAAKAKNEAARKAREAEESFREVEQSQIQRLQKNKARSSMCLHGFDPFPDDDICIKFIRAFLHEFYTCCCEKYKDESQAERAIIECLLEAREVTKDEYSEIWNSDAKMKQVISYFLYNGTMHILDGEDSCATNSVLNSALIARFYDQWLKVNVHKSQACIDWPKVMESGGCERTGVKFIWRRIRCSCLDEKYEEVKSITKIGKCFNPECRLPERLRSELRCCSRCRSVTYCSRECQVADWSVHKELCDDVAATRAEFDASKRSNKPNAEPMRRTASKTDSAESNGSRNSNSIDIEKKNELQSRLMTLHALIEEPLPLPGAGSGYRAYMEGVRAQLITILKFVEENLPLEKIDMGKVDELVEMYRQEAKEEMSALSSSQTQAPARALFSEDQYNDSELEEETTERR